MSLMANDFLYRRYVAEVKRLHALGSEKALEAVERAAWIAWRFHPGRLADGALENVLFEAGQRIGGRHEEAAQAPGRSSEARSRTLHLATEIYATGGHSRALTKWIDRDESTASTLVLTRQRGALPEFLAQIWQRRGTALTVLNPGDTIVERARQVRTLARAHDRVILHHHPDDAVPVVAFAREGGPPVAMFNHAHFWFSLGSSVADIVLNTLPYYRTLTERFRFPRATGFIVGPGGLEPIDREPVDKAAARHELGLPRDAKVVMTIGNAEYFRPKGGLDFFAFAMRLLERRDDIVLVVVGVPPDFDAIPQPLRRHGRIRFTGPVLDPIPFYRASMLCLESFPMPSLGAVIEAAAFGQACPVLTFAETENVIRPSFPDLVVRQRSESSYLDDICGLLDDPEATDRKAAAIRASIAAQDAAFGAQFPQLYERIAELVHRPERIPETGCSTEQDNFLLADMGEKDIGSRLAGARRDAGAIRAHLSAAARGFEPWRGAVRGILRVPYRYLRAAASR